MEEEIKFQQIIDQDDPRAIINLVPKKIQNAIWDLYNDHEHLTNLSEQEFLKENKTSQNMDMMRLSFWREYNRAQDSCGKMITKNIYGPVMSADTFYEKFLSKPINVAWMLIPPDEYQLALETYLSHGRQALREILTANKFNEDGTLNVQVAKVILQAYALIDNRIHGSAIQRIEQKTATISMTNPESEVSGSQEELRKELEELRANSIEAMPSES